jgi:hypothetical protein
MERIVFWIFLWLFPTLSLNKIELKQDALLKA